jgi:hypothetical protein
MSSLNTLTGVHGAFMVGTGYIIRSTKWDVSPSVSASEWGDSESGGHTNRAAGRKDNKFSSEGKYDTTSEVFDLFYPADIAAAKLYMSTTLAMFWYFPRALCQDFKMTVDMDKDEVIGWTSSWGEDGRSYRPGEATEG